MKGFRDAVMGDGALFTADDGGLGQIQGEGIGEWQLVEIRQALGLAGRLMEEELALADEPGAAVVDLEDFLALDAGVAVGIALAASLAEGEDGANGAGGAGAEANGGTQLHEGFVVEARGSGIEEAVGESIEGLNGLGVAAEEVVVGSQASEDADDVAIHDSGGGGKGEAGNGGGGIGADTREGLPLILSDGRGGAQGELFGEGVEVPRAVVVAEALPCLEDLFLGSLGERREIGPAGNPCLEIGGGGADLGLLEHEF